MRCQPRCVTTPGRRSRNLESLMRPTRPSTDNLLVPRRMCRLPVWDLVGHKICSRPRLYWRHLRDRPHLWTRQIQWGRAFKLPRRTVATSRQPGFIPDFPDEGDCSCTVRSNLHLDPRGSSKLGVGAWSTQRMNRTAARLRSLLSASAATQLPSPSGTSGTRPRSVSKVVATSLGLPLSPPGTR
jgi:hypothetical protein